MSPENNAHYESEKEEIDLLLTKIGDEIYSTIDACKTAYQIFYKMMNEMIRNNLTVDTMQVNVQFLQQLQPEWSRVNQIHAERIVKNSNPLSLIVAALPYPNPYYQAPKYHKPYAPTSKQSSSTRSITSTRFKGKEIAKPITPPSESSYEEDSDLEQAQRDKDMQKKLALNAKYFKKIYKPTNNNLRTYLNSRNKNVDTSPSFMAKIKEVPTADSRINIEPLEQVQYDVEYNVFSNERQHSEQPESISNTCVVEKVNSNVIHDSPDMCDKDIQTDQNDVECEDEQPVTPHSWPQVRKLSFAKPYGVNAPSPSRQILIGQKFSPNKSSNVYMKTTPPRSGLTQKPTGRIFTQVGLKWIPIRKSIETGVSGMMALKLIRVSGMTALKLIRVSGMTALKLIRGVIGLGALVGKVTIEKGWISWGNYCDMAFKETHDEILLEYTMNCRAFDKFVDQIPHWVWLSWIPQLLLSLQRSKAQHCKLVLRKVSTVHRQ
nr:transformation/transcription domain-associated protein-like [Tanacetum cinerariifolium]